MARKKSNLIKKNTAHIIPKLKKSTHKQKNIEAAINQLEQHIESLHAGWWDV